MNRMGPWKTDAALSMNADIQSSAMKIMDMEGFAYQVNISGTPNGTLKLQGSVDGSTFNDIDSSSQTVTSGQVNGVGSAVWNDSDVYFPWIRVAWVKTSGTGTMDVWFAAKGAQ